MLAILFKFPLGISAEADEIIKVAAIEANTMYFIVSLQLFRPQSSASRNHASLSRGLVALAWTRHSWAIFRNRSAFCPAWSINLRRRTDENVLPGAEPFGVLAEIATRKCKTGQRTAQHQCYKPDRRGRNWGLC